MGVSEHQNCVEDLATERKKCSFNTLELTYYLDGGKEETETRRRREDYFLSDPNLRTPIPEHFLSHKERYEESVRKSCFVVKRAKEIEEKYGEDRTELIKLVLGSRLGHGIIKDTTPFGTHFAMFLPTILNQCTPEQQKKWLIRAYDCEIIGTYAQTELGHGTFIKGLETTAHYDPNTQEFVLNSPTLSSYKWWPGGMAHTANYSILIAQLYSKGVCYGIHPFLVQLRDEESHMPLPGITIGEIGSKLGMNTANNGYLAFKNVRIPRDHLLMKNVKITEDGSYVKAQSDKLAYGTMVLVRVGIVQSVAGYLSKAVTIATRYSAVRRQSQLKSGKPEVQVLDFLTQQYKLFPHIASCLALKFAGNWLWNVHTETVNDLEKGNLNKLPELHALSCCLKAVCSSDASTAIEICRMACGGHGYLDSSNFTSIYGACTAACTYEGENTVLLLQTARHLMKVMKQILNNEPLTPTVSYLKSASVSRLKWNNSIEAIVTAYQQMAAGKVKSAADAIEEKIKRGISSEDAWNMCSLKLVQCAEAHCRMILVEKFVETVQSAKVSKNVSQVLNQLCELYALFWILEKRGEFLMFSNITPSIIDQIQRRFENLLADIRPNAIGIVDSFDYRDEILNSTLGAWDGRVYERLMEGASLSPLNEEPVNSSFHKYLKPLMKSNL